MAEIDKVSYTAQIGVEKGAFWLHAKQGLTKELDM